jgi:hypothetical protein
MEEILEKLAAKQLADWAAYQATLDECNATRRAHEVAVAKRDSAHAQFKLSTAQRKAAWTEVKAARNK